MKEKDEGSKLIKVYWEGIKFAIKFVDAEAMIIKIKAKETKRILSNLPIISVGLVKIISTFCWFKFWNASAPVTINNEKNEKIIRFKIKLKLPFLNSCSFLTYLEKSPNDKIIIEKKVNVVLQL